MKKSGLENISNKNKWLVFVFFVSFSLFVSENVFGYKHFKKEYITAKWDIHDKYIIINAQVYNYSKSNYGFLAHCEFEGSADSLRNPYTIMEIKTPDQAKSSHTNLFLQNKLPYAKISLLDFINKDKSWPEKMRASLFGPVPNYDDLATARLAWLPDQAHSKVYLIYVSGKWNNGTDVEKFSYVINLKSRLPHKMTQSDDQKENTDAKEINPVEVYGESDAVVVKGAESGATIMICNESGVEIKSVVANSNIERINLPANQLYLIHIGKSQYKVAL